MNTKLRSIILFSMTILAGGLVTISAMPARANQDICVKCTGPDMTYNCLVDTGGAVTGGLPIQLFCIRELARLGGHERCGVKRRARAACQGVPRSLVYGAPTQGDRTAPIAALPSNAANPNVALPNAENLANNPAASQNSDGPTALIPPDGGASARDPNAPVAVNSPRVEPATKPVVKPKPDAGLPRTVEEMAKRAAASSKKQLKNAGELVTGGVKGVGNKVNNAAKTTWRCLSSLFTKCN